MYSSRQGDETRLKADEKAKRRVGEEAIEWTAGVSRQDGHLELSERFV
jgi:hypothetical protein